MNLSPARSRISTLNNPANMCRTPTNGGKNPPKISFVYNKDRVIGANPVQSVVPSPICTRSPLRIKAENEENINGRECKENMVPMLSNTPTAKIYSRNNVVFQRTTSCLTPSKANIQMNQNAALDKSPIHHVNLNRATTSYIPPTVMTPVKNGQNFFRAPSNIPPSKTSARCSFNSNDQSNSSALKQSNSITENSTVIDNSKKKIMTEQKQNMPSPKRSLYLPPLSPKKTRKTSEKVKQNSSLKKNNQNSLQTIKSIPSFILQKEKLKEKEAQNGIIEEKQQEDTGRDECKCGNSNPTHSDLREKEKYCTKCGVQKMLDGIQLKQYVSPLKNKNSIDPAALSPSLLWQQKQDESAELSFSCPSKHHIEEVSSFLSISHTGDKKNSSSKISIKQPSKQMEIEQFIKEMEEQKQSLQKIQSTIENSDQEIYKFYRDQKISLKEHYEKIKAAIKLSIQEDLRQLTQMEKQDLEELTQEKKLIRRDINKISQIIDKDIKGTLMPSNRSFENEERPYQQTGRFSNSKEKFNMHKRRVSANLQQSFESEEERMIILPSAQSHRHNNSNLSNNSSLCNQGNYQQVLKKGKEEVSKLRQKYRGYSSQILGQNKSFEKNLRYGSQQQLSGEGEIRISQKIPSFLKLPSGKSSMIISDNGGSSRSIMSKKSASDFDKLYTSTQFRMIEDANMRKKRSSIILEVEEANNQEREEDISFSSNNQIQNNHNNSDTMDPISYQNRIQQSSVNSASEQLEETCTFEKKNVNFNVLEQQEEEYYLHLRSGSNLHQQQQQYQASGGKKNGVLFSFENKNKKQQQH